VAPGTLYENTTTWSYTITSSGPETTVTDASGNLMKILYDGAGRETVQQQRDSDNTGQLFTISSGI
jgi:YD repeat-containing protein